MDHYFISETLAKYFNARHFMMKSTGFLMTSAWAAMLNPPPPSPKIYLQNFLLTFST